MMKHFALVLFVLLFPALAWAGSYDGTVYTSNLGYTVKPPSTWDGHNAIWDRVDASNAVAMKNHIPQNIAIEGIDRFDVVFFPRFTKTDTSLEADRKRAELNKDAAPEDIEPPYEDKAKVPEFYPSVSILVLNMSISDQSPEMVEAYKQSLLQNVPDVVGFAQDFNIVDATKDAVNSENGFIFKIHFRVDSHEVEMEQIILSRRSSTYIISCTKDSNDNHLPLNWCKNVANSMQF
ncbi:MAG: hypothetical protein J6A01_00185 [Proteobacteria bacterium]|nr:hypothetical protein [Pseudomonadota bacterium]